MKGGGIMTLLVVTALAAGAAWQFSERCTPTVAPAPVRAEVVAAPLPERVVVETPEISQADARSWLLRLDRIAKDACRGRQDREQCRLNTLGEMVGSTVPAVQREFNCTDGYPNDVPPGYGKCLGVE